MTIKEYNLCVNEHSDKLYRFILKSMRDRNRAQDVVQDAFEKLWLKIDKVESNKAKAYLFTIAYNKMIDIFRKENRSSYLEDSQLESGSEDHAYSDIKDVLDEALNKLPEIDVLINNAGSVFDKRLINNDGVEKTFALNHLSYFHLSLGLLDKLENSKDPRIVNISSNAHKRYNIDINDLDSRIKKIL